MGNGRGVLDEMFDFADNVVGGVETMYGRRAATPAPASRPVETKHQLSSGWRMTSVRQQTGEDMFFVTNGQDLIACSNKAIAERVCILLGGNV